MKNPLLVCFAVLVLLARAQAQTVPNLINYQGRISVGTTNFTGTGQFRFALTNSDGSTFYWTNDATGSPSGQQPVNYVPVTVTKGLYSVLLGDTSLPNMTAIPTSLWSNPDVRLRVYFSDGTNTSQALSPDQRLAPTGYLASGLTLAGTPTFSGDLNLPATTSAATGVLDIGSAPFLHAYGANGLGSGNTFAGSTAGNFTLSGTLNTGTGYQTLTADTSGSGNTASGATALKSNTAGIGNTAVGLRALLNNTTGAYNSAVGSSTLVGNSTAGENVAVGTGALQLQSFDNGGTAWNSLNVAVGYQALYSNQPTATTNGTNNTALGANALFYNTTGANNTAVGYQAGGNLTTGGGNIAIGYQAGYSLNSNGNNNNNIDIGNSGQPGDTATIRLGDVSTHTDTFLVGVLHATALAAGVPLGTATVDTSLGLRLINRDNSGTTSAPNITGIGFGQGSIRQAIVGETFGNDGLDFYVSGNLTTPKVRIDANGRLGVGTINPAYTLDVTGAERVSTAIYDDGTLSVTGNTFLTGNLTLNGSLTVPNGIGFLNLAATSSATAGVLGIGGTPFLHAYGANGLSSENTFVGSGSGDFTMLGSNNTGVGYHSLSSVGNGTDNTALGAAGLSANQTGVANTAVGSSALLNTTAGFNTAVGYQALQTNTTGVTNTGIGYQANVSVGNLTNATAIGNSAVVSASNTIQLGNGNITSLRCQVALTVTSDRNQKENFAPVDGAEVLRKLRGFEIPSWNFIGQDSATLRHYGPMAQDFFAAFGHDAVGTSGNDTTINSGDLAGITLIAVRELATENVDSRKHAAEQDEQIKALRDENAALKKQLAQQNAMDDERAKELAARLAKLEQFLPQATETPSQTVALKTGQ